jgi:phytoene dehydrogenase-like protein
MIYDAIIVGGGIAGLTSACYLSEAGFKVLLCEKEKKTGGLVNSFDYKGFKFDGGIRSLENSGIIFPMVKQLGLDIEFVRSVVSLGIEEDVIKVDTIESLVDYQQLLNRKFPDNIDEIEPIIKEIKKMMGYMDVLYGIDNPLFLDLKNDKEYLFKEIIPWAFKFLSKINKINKLNEPVEDYLHRFTDNQVLIDVIAQHFFKETPTFFALSYFSLYLDYNYPINGTGELTEKMDAFYKEHGGEVFTDTLITTVDPENKFVIDSNGNQYNYKKLIWAADVKNLHNLVDVNKIKNDELKNKIRVEKEKLSLNCGGDSVLTVYLTLNLDKSYFESLCTEHFFYTPVKVGLSNAKVDQIILSKNKNNTNVYSDDKKLILDWLQKYYNFTTYEISCPVMRNETLAPKNKTGLIISTLMDYSLVKHINDMGWYQEFKELSERCIIDSLNSSIFKELKDNIIDQFSATPLTIERMTANSDGAITGWSFLNEVPVENEMTKVSKSVLTCMPDIYMAGQWSFSPSGLPMSVLTGKIASDKVKKELK